MVHADDVHDVNIGLCPPNTCVIPCKCLAIRRYTARKEDASVEIDGSCACGEINVAVAQRPASATNHDR
jgi:hypothetical protein